MLVRWLGQTPKLEEYTEKLLNHGCDTKELMQKLTAEDLEELGFASMHIREILASLRANDAEPLAASPMSPAPTL